jgi:hypothetical protein
MIGNHNPWTFPGDVLQSFNMKTIKQADGHPTKAFNCGVEGHHAQTTS